MTRWLHVVALTLAGCIDDGESVDAAYIAPARGQTMVALGAPLQVYMSGHGLPPDYDPGEPVRVVDLARGGLVEGVTKIEGDELSFTPLEGWLPDSDYAWTIDLSTPQAHGPEYAFPQHVAGAASFSTSANLALLGVALSPGRELCIVLSRPATATEVDHLVATASEGCCLAEGEQLDLDLQPLPQEDWGDPVQINEESPGIDVYCDVLDDIQFHPTSVLKIELEGMVWWAEVQAQRIGQLIADLRRAECQPVHACPPYPSTDDVNTANTGASAP